MHEGGYSVAFDDAGTPIFKRPDGTIVQCVAARPRATPTDIVDTNAGIDVYRPPEVPEEAGRRIDLGEAVDTLFFQPSERHKLPPQIKAHYDRFDQPNPRPEDDGPDEQRPPPGGG